MRTSGGRGSTRAERENVATATARRASHVVASYPLSPTKFEKPAQRAGFFVSVVLTDMQHRFREIQPYCTPLPGAAQSALPGLRVQRCLRAGSPDRCASIASGKSSRTAHRSRGRRKAPCPGYGVSVVCGPVARTDAQHRLREIQPHRTPLPGAAQSTLPGLRVQRCLRAV